MCRVHRRRPDPGLMLTRAGVAAAAGLLAAAPAAAEAARALAYQGYTSQGHQIAFKRSSAGVFSVKIALRANCVNDQGKNEGNYDFSLRAAGTVADPGKGVKCTVRIAGQKKTPNATITGTIIRRGAAPGTFVAALRVTIPT